MKHAVVLLVLAGAALLASAAPAFTADSGTVAVTVTAGAPVSPCIEFATPPGTAVSFGTLAFSRPNAPSSSRGNVTPTYRNCSTAAERVVINGTDATSAGAVWALETSQPTCNATSPRNQYLIRYFHDQDPLQALAKTATTLAQSAAPGADHTLTLELIMPCEGSDGAGETFSASILLTAATA